MFAQETCVGIVHTQLFQENINKLAFFLRNQNSKQQKTLLFNALFMLLIVVKH